MTSPESAVVNEAPGHEALRIWFEADKSRTFAGMARVLNLTPATVSYWCRAEDPARPSSMAIMFALEALTSIPPHAWLRPAELAWLREVSQGKFAAVFERPKRQVPADERQMHFDAFWLPNAPQQATDDVFDADAAI
jgi:hypothetical protein